MMTALPLSIREQPPFRHALRINGTRWDGLPDGVHTGGAYAYQGLVYKPLDGRPGMEAQAHYPTQEAQFLEVFAGRPFFPRNWWLETHNERQWLVRPRATILQPQDLALTALEALWTAIQEVNAAGWEIGDLLSIGRLDGVLFVVDCSCAHEQRGAGAYWADDEHHIARLWKAAGHGDEWEARQRRAYLQRLQERYPDEFAALTPKQIAEMDCGRLFFELYHLRRELRVGAE